MFQKHVKAFHGERTTLPNPVTPSNCVCSQCFQTFDTLDQLNAHRDSVHNSANDVKSKNSSDEIFISTTCVYCPFTCDKPSELCDHLLQVHHPLPTTSTPEQLRPTDLSTKSTPIFSDEPPFVKRIKKSSDSFSTSPPQPPLTPQTPQLLPSTGFDFPNTLLCSQCDAALPDFESFRIHLKSHLERGVMGNQMIQCTQCLRTFKDHQALDKHILEHFMTARKEFICKSCTSTFASEEDLQKHFVDIHAQIIYKCTLCQEVFEAEMQMQVSSNNKSDQFTDQISLLTAMVWHMT